MAARDNKHRLANSTDYSPADHLSMMAGQTQVTLMIVIPLTGLAANAMRSTENLPWNVFTMNNLCVLFGLCSIALTAFPYITWANILQHRATSFYDRVWSPLTLERSSMFGTCFMAACLLSYGFSHFEALLLKHTGEEEKFFLNACLLVVTFVISFASCAAMLYLTHGEKQWPELVPLRETHLSGRGKKEE